MEIAAGLQRHFVSESGSLVTVHQCNRLGQDGSYRFISGLAEKTDQRVEKEVPKPWALNSRIPAS